MPHVLSWKQKNPNISIFYSSELLPTSAFHFSISLVPTSKVPMAQNHNSQEQPLLLSGNSKRANFSEKSPWFLSLAKWTLKCLMWVILIIWVCAIFFFCIGRDILQKWIKATQGTIFGITGSIFLGFSAPILIIAFLAFIYISAFPGDDFEKKKSKFPRFRLWTFPVLVDGPFGVVSATEFIGIVLFIVYVLWTMTYYTVENTEILSKEFIPSKEKSFLMLELTGLRLGLIGLFCMVFLFLPVARGSILLRLIDIPFEHATRYHVWLGHLTMFLFTLHGLFYMISWGLQGILLKKMLEWADIGVANLPGVISLSAGLLMWVTSLHPVRKKQFELFFYTHQLYVVFVVFLALHVGDFVFSMVAGAVFLFMLDRFLRFCQSRTKVDLLSASCRPCGTIELTFSKPANLHYNALSFTFVQVRELSWLQWHPFSVSSSPLDGKNHISVLIKVLGSWTDKLRDIIRSYPDQSKGGSHLPPSRITASVEGPYGHESPYHLMYENLILVAGGIGISPFLAILSDILHRVQEEKPCLPKNILVIWAVKKSKELSLLSAVDAQSTFPSFFERLDLDIQTFVTQQTEPSLEEGKIEQTETVSFPSIFMKHGSHMSSLVGTGNNLFGGLYVVLSTLGFIVLFGFVQVYYIEKFGIYQWWYRGLLYTACMVAGVVFFGGVVIILWHFFEERREKHEKLGASNENSNDVAEPVLNCEMGQTGLASVQTVNYGCRPNFEELFTNFSDKVGSADIGVLVCGPPALQCSVAKECRSQNLQRGRKNHAIFHFNSHSFDL
ncbi:ferric reduction oxidase 7 [Rhynchospora pubera]|uniref:ferric-chelate reductase (NADH) n=1 Tax=Rhynchospora pubera TaxID=906938 RepID=A0AAV8D024_9POAL|nr:ferric reduction oxidase 7 [Rhynchospora pubera]